jgi:hypothetical protein
MSDIPNSERIKTVVELAPTAEAVIAQAQGVVKVMQLG